VISDLEAIKAIDRLCRAAPRNLDLDALRVWIAAHCGLIASAGRIVSMASCSIGSCVGPSSPRKTESWVKT
jgi:hypothetical protein